MYLTSANPKADPALDFCYFTDPEDYDAKCLVDGLKQARKIAAQEPLKQWLKEEVAPGLHVQSDEDLSAYARKVAHTVYHPAVRPMIRAARDQVGLLIGPASATGYLQDGRFKRSFLRCRSSASSHRDQRSSCRGCECLPGELKASLLLEDCALISEIGADDGYTESDVSLAASTVEEPKLTRILSCTGSLCAPNSDSMRAGPSADFYDPIPLQADDRRKGCRPGLDGPLPRDHPAEPLVDRRRPYRRLSSSSMPRHRTSRTFLPEGRASLSLVHPDVTTAPMLRGSRLSQAITPLYPIPSIRPRERESPKVEAIRGGGHCVTATSNFIDRLGIHSPSPHCCMFDSERVLLHDSFLFFSF